MRRVVVAVGALAMSQTAVAPDTAGQTAPAQVLILPGAPLPAPGPFDAPSGAPMFRRALPRETPPEQMVIDASVPITDFAVALERAYWTNPQLLAERARLRGADFRVPQARGQYGPQLRYSISYGYQRDRFDQPLGQPITRTGWSSTASAILAQPLFTSGRLRANEDAARASVAFGRGLLRAAEQQTLFDAIAAYSSVIRDRTGVRIAGDNLALLSREFGDTQARLLARETTITDAQQVETRLELARVQLVLARGAAASSDALFLRFVGAPAGELAAPNPLVVPARTLEDAYAYADAHNPVIATAYARERISRAEMSAARAELFPRVDLIAQADYGPQTPYSNSPRQTGLRAGVSLTGTIDSGIRRARIAEVSADNDADWRLIDSALRENRAELASAWNEWQTKTRVVELLGQAAQAANLAIEGALLQERAGLRTTLDVLQLARDLLQARSELNATSVAAYVAQARVLAAMGALEQNYLMPDTPKYEPEIHYSAVDGQADIPVLTSLVRALDGLATGRRADRPIRDPAAPVAISSVTTDPSLNEAAK